MDPRTLTLYLLAGGLSIGLSVVLLVVAKMNPRGRLAKYSAYGILLCAVGFVAFGISPDVPRWVVVIGSNLALLSACTVLYSAFRAYFHDAPPRLDRVGLALVAFTTLPFWYWGLIEPDGAYRSAVFSFVLAIIAGRTSLMLWREARKRGRGALQWLLCALFGVLAMWMVARGFVSLLGPPAPAVLRGANPTSWVTVFWFIVFLSLIAVCILWLEVGTKANHRRGTAEAAIFATNLIEYFRRKLILLWAVVAIVVMSILSEAGVVYTKSSEWEAERLAQSTALTNDAMALHSNTVINQVDTILHSVRNFFLRTHSFADTDAFIDALPFDRTTVDNVYVINASGDVAVSHDSMAGVRSVADRDYFQFHRSNPQDQIFVASVEAGRVTGSFHFRATRRINLPDGSFGGVVLATVNPQSFSRYYQELAVGTQTSAGLLGTADFKFRARFPELPASQWQVPLESPLWNLLQQTPTGQYKSTSSVDSIERIFAYRKIAGLPLVMVTGFSVADLNASVLERMRWMILGTMTVLLVVLTLATLLTIEIHRRNEQDRFMSMLSHELKTPLSVLRMALGTDGPLSANTRTHAQQSVSDMDAIVERCLQAGRMEHHRHGSARQTCDIADVLAELQTSCDRPERLALETQEVPPFTADVPLLRIALHNLIDNALKYAPAADTVQVSASHHTHRRRAGVLVAVSNAPGVAGMPDPSRVFGKYYRSPGAHSKTGSGLGLYLVHSAAKQLGGWVRYAPQGNAQVRFELWLPV